MRVETARGAMAVDGLGTTLMHEQVFVLTPDVEWILRAVGQTHVETGTPITVHTSAALKTGLIAQRIPKEEVVDLTKVESATAVIRPTALLPRWNYTHITDDVLPALREHGVGEAQITAMLVHNPARYFTGGQE